MANGAIARLEAGSRRPERDLQRLSAAWYTITSCFDSAATVPHAKPSDRGVAVVVAHLGHASPGVMNAAFSALRAAEIVCRHGRYPDLPRHVWGFDGVVDGVRSLLESEHFSARLAAARFVAEAPTDALVEVLRRGLHDSLFTVRWHSICALAKIAPTPELADAWVSARPRHLDAASLAPGAYLRDQSRNGAFLDALDALGPLRADVVHQLLR